MKIEANIIDIVNREIYFGEVTVQDAIIRSITRPEGEGDVPFVVETLDGLACQNTIFFSPSGKRARRE